MGKKDNNKIQEDYHQFMLKTIRKAEKNKKNGENKEPFWFGLGMFGLIGWSVALPLILFTFLGLWLDSMISSQYSWTLMMIVGGVLVGCLNAWYWVKREEREIDRDYDKKHSQD